MDRSDPGDEWEEELDAEPGEEEAEPPAKRGWDALGWRLPEEEAPTLPVRGKFFEGKRLPGKPKGSTQRQCFWDKVILAMVTHVRIEDAAEELGISRAAIYKCLRDPEFCGQLNEHRQRVTAHGMLRIQNALPDAVAVVKNLMEDTGQPGAVRLAASKLIIDHNTKTWEEDRSVAREQAHLEALERIKEEIVAGRYNEEDQPALPVAPVYGAADSGGDQAPDAAVEEGDGSAGPGGEGTADDGL